jgi:hypothetical protein
MQISVSGTCRQECCNLCYHAVYDTSGDGGGDREAYVQIWLNVVGRESCVKGLLRIVVRPSIFGAEHADSNVTSLFYS